MAGFLLAHPVFELRRSLLIRAGEWSFDLRHLCLGADVGDYFPIRQGDAQYVGRLDLELDLPGPPEIDAEADEVLAPMHWIWFARATVTKCRRLLDQPLTPVVALAPHLAAVHPGDTGFLPGTIGAAVEEAIYDGSLYRLLRQDVERRLGILEQYVGEREEVLARRRSAARKLWN